MRMQLTGIPLSEIQRIKKYWEKKGYHVELMSSWSESLLIYKDDTFK